MSERGAFITELVSERVIDWLVLVEVYDWMVQNIPYFKDKGDSNSSAGWKVGRNNNTESSIIFAPSNGQYGTNNVTPCGPLPPEQKHNRVFHKLCMIIREL